MRKCPHPVLGLAGGEECHQLKAGVWGQLAGETAPRRWGSEPDSRVHLSRRPGLWKQCPQLCETRERTLNAHGVYQQPRCLYGHWTWTYTQRVFENRPFLTAVYTLHLLPLLRWGFW